MTVRELVKNLKDFDPDVEVVVDATLDDGSCYRILIELRALRPLEVGMPLSTSPFAIIEGVQA